MEKRGPGRPKGSTTGRTKVRVHISITPALVNWAMQQPGGVSATVSRCLEKMQRQTVERAEKPARGDA